MASDSMEVDGGDQVNDGISNKKKKTGATPNTNTSSSQSTQQSGSAATLTAPRYKYKYPEAHPTPPGEDDEVWNKLFTAADSRLYNRHGKSATESKKYRTSGETYQLALRMLQEKKDKAAGISAPSGSAISSSLTTTPKATTKKTPPTTSVKKEPSTSSRDATPSTDKMSTMSISEKVKGEGRARKASSAAAPSDNDAPGPSTATASTVMGSPAPPPLPATNVEKHKKKGTATAVVKKKLGPKPKTDDTADTPSNSTRASMTPATKTGPSSEEDSNDGGEYCICRGPDDHRMMVNCEGGCEDWYHCSCLKMDVADAKELLDVFICPKCTTETLHTTWKRMCRYYNVGKWLKDPNPCRKAARVSLDPPSKYCSDEHLKAFWEFVKTLCRTDDEPSRGGRLSQGEVGWLLSQGLTAAEIHALGAKPRLPVKEGADPNRPPGLDYLTEEEEKQLQQMKDRQDTIEIELQGYRNQEKLRIMILARAEKAAEHLELKSVKEICGYDNRLAMNQAEFAKWCKTEEGKRALGSGVLSPRTSESKSIGAHVLMPGQVAPDTSDAPDVLNNICVKKKCIKHHGWASVHKDEFSYSYNLLIQERKKLSDKQSEIIDDAELREAMKPEYADNITIQLF